MEASNDCLAYLKPMEQEIHERFPSFPRKRIARILQKYRGVEHSQRLRCVLHELLHYNSTRYSPEAIQSDVAYILGIFPNACRRDVTQRLQSLGKIVSRFEVVVKELLAGQNTTNLKRRSNDILFDKRLNAELQIPLKRQILNSTEINNINKIPFIDPISNGITTKLYTIDELVGISGPSTSRNDNYFNTYQEPVIKLEAPIPEISPQSDVVELDSNNSDVDEDEVMDITDDHLDTRLLYHIMEMFPSADPQFLREQVKGKEFNETEIGNVVDIIFNTPNYPKRNDPTPEEHEDDAINPDAKIETLREILPNADPTFLMNKLQNISTEKEFQAFVSKCLEHRDYPTYKEYLRKQQLSAQVKQYTTNFSVEKFVELIPDPEAFFNNPKCKAMLIKKGNDTYHYIYNFLRNHYPKTCVRQIKTVLEKSPTIKQACENIEASTTGILRTKRKTLYSLDGLTDIPLLQVFAYVDNKEEILNYIKDQKDRDRQLREAAKTDGLLKTCGCCYDDEVMHYEEATCEAGCIFCKTCVEQSVKILFYEEKLEFPCLGDCGSKFGIQTLQRSLKPKIFSKLVQKKQLEEIKAAGIEDIEFCPFCDFATIVAPENKLFVCLNPDCMKESCRLCKETSHIPLRCEEIEKDEDVKNRVYIENKMTEALIRKCYKCGLTFIKSDGCNKMTCSCGAMMCYICNKPVHNYKHFNGQGGNQRQLCPLYSDTIALHRDAVLKSAAIAKRELGEEVKIDPTIGLEEYYKEQMKSNPNRVPPGM